MVAIVFDPLKVAGVEVYGLDSWESSADSDGDAGWSSESSNAGRDGRDGMSCPSISSMRLHILEGVSNVKPAILTKLDSR